MAECLRTPSLKCLLMLTAYVITVHFPSKEIKSLLLLSFRLYSDFNNFPLMLSFSSRTQTACRLIWLSSFFKACLSLFLFTGNDWCLLVCSTAVESCACKEITRKRTSFLLLLFHLLSELFPSLCYPGFSSELFCRLVNWAVASTKVYLEHEYNAPLCSESRFSFSTSWLCIS